MSIRDVITFDQIAPFNGGGANTYMAPFWRHSWGWYVVNSRW